ncbi:hypothetical protein C4D60_Mb03t09050 [Musa balbisiana]|uniref:Uncharacterized protein n=1 Tax=Musa balbisiana TaxID=52838 RepID=A0A4S8J8Y0_MUSBA|nr:hypothetical protein C4D60_Mb03t09050 [Musa balbisiana]
MDYREHTQRLLTVISCNGKRKSSTRGGGERSRGEGSGGESHINLRRQWIGLEDKPLNALRSITRIRFHLLTGVGVVWVSVTRLDPMTHHTSLQKTETCTDILTTFTVSPSPTQAEVATSSTKPNISMGSNLVASAI